MAAVFVFDIKLSSSSLLERSISAHRSGNCFIFSESVGNFRIAADRAFFVDLPFFFLAMFVPVILV